MGKDEITLISNIQNNEDVVNFLKDMDRNTNNKRMHMLYTSDDKWAPLSDKLFLESILSNHVYLKSIYNLTHAFSLEKKSIKKVCDNILFFCDSNNVNNNNHSDTKIINKSECNSSRFITYCFVVLPILFVLLN